MNVGKLRALVSSNWLRTAISEGKKLTVLEAAWTKNDAGYTSYLDMHIPSAQYYNMWKGVTPSLVRPRDMPSPRIFEEYAQELGIEQDSQVIIYDKGVGFFSSRLWYTFKVFGHEDISVLDGGMLYWLNQGFPTESGKPHKVKPSTYQVKGMEKSYLKTFEEMKGNKENNNFQILDVRSPGAFSGTEQEPSDSTVAALTSAGFEAPDEMIAGHMHRAKNIPNSTFINPETNCFQSAENLLHYINGAGIDLEKPLAVHCYNGVSACLVPVALSQLKEPTQLSIYVGSWTEYGQQATEDDIEPVPDKPALGG